ncbi:quinon protein alcohol dehydrogenase-like superfamily [Aspergillus cavernicola]|uniref:Quinon protein alcohol dehydrogenase-like superfamily n=1 Tax=Aspergillus cavernicola TaxID=176166 RepID=A0ABR4IYZ8_9EURO
MTNNTLGLKSKTAAAAPSLRSTPSNSPSLRPPTRSSNKPSLYQSALPLQTVIGTTTTTPNGFSYHDQSKSFAFCAGSAAVLAELDDNNNANQRFFRARPSAASINPVTSFYNPSTPPTTPDTRLKSLPSIKTVSYNGIYNGSPSGEMVETPSPRAWSSRERVKAVTSVAISPNGRLLAVGETGYNPRVLIFSTAKDAPPDIPLSILTEHSFGVRALAWSPNSQYLATLGDVNDGFLFIWSIGLKNGSARLHSTNKCTTVVRDMTWLDQTLITVGIRHVKVWRLPETRPVSPSKSRTNTGDTPNFTSPKALTGRNCVLNSLADNTFTSVVRISDSEAVVGTDSGALCLVDDNEGNAKLTLIQYMDFGVTSLTVDPDRACIWIGGRGRRMQSFSFDSLRCSSSPSSPRAWSRSSTEQRPKEPAITCIGFLTSHLVTVDGTKAIHIYPIENFNDEGEHCDTGISMPAHRDAVLGIGQLRTPNHLKADFFTWSCKGVVKFWNTEGECRDSRTVAVEQLSGGDDDTSNELKILRANNNMDLFVSGDRLGILRVIQGQSWSCINEVRAHGSEITDIALYETPDSCVVASSGRDRMVQLFERRDDRLQLIQTMDDHVGAVSQLLFVNGGEKLLSSSADRTVLIRERVSREADGATAIAYLISRVIHLRSSPVSMSLSPDEPENLVFSTVDRCVWQYDMRSGRHIHSFRAADTESNDTVVMGSLTVTSAVSGRSPKLLIGVSGTDKSIRVYDLEKGALLTGEFGHTEGVSDVRLLEKYPSGSNSSPERILISSGIDGVVMIWNLSVQLQQSQEFTLPTQATSNEEEDIPSKGSSISKPPLRKVLSRSELAGFHRPEYSAIPTPMREVPEQSPPLLRKLSRMSLVPSLKYGNAAPATPPSAPTRRSPTSSSRPERMRNSPSPPSPRSTGSRKILEPRSSRNNVRCSPLDFRARARTGKSELGSLNMSTEQVCRTLKAYRKKLNGSTEHLHSQKELERELSLTLRILNTRTKKVEPESGETETDSSGKENERIPPPPPPPPNENRRIPRRVPSTPNLGQKKSPRYSRRRSLDAAGEG